MTKDKQRKNAIRAEQHRTGRRYTPLAREMPVAQRTDRTFLLQELLAECATLPAATVDWGYPDDFAPAIFESRLLGSVVPYGTVLELAGCLAREGTQARLTLESLSPLGEAVVVCRKRRIQLVLNQDMAYDLCRTPGCSAQPINWAITWCTGHLRDCDTQALVRMARDWGHRHSEDVDRNPDRLGGSRESDLLIKAAVALGSFERIRQKLLDSCFGDPNLFDEEFWDPAEALAMQHALERERLRLYDLAQAEGLRIRKTIKLCTGCGHQLYGWNSSIPPQYCPECAPPPAEGPLYVFAS